MLLRLVKTGLFAGFVTALVYSVVQAITVTPLILEAEVYEQSSGGHHHNGTDADHAHQPGEEAAAWEPDDGFERYAFSVLANIVTGVGFAFMIVAAIAIRGRPVDARSGLLWGAAGFAVFGVAPALGLPPEVPGAAAAALEARQLWWVGTVVATAVGLGLIAFARPRLLRIGGAVLLFVPHLIGAPRPEGLDPGPVPPELASLYVVWSLVTTSLFWAVLGCSCGEIYRRLEPTRTRQTAATEGSLAP